ncbi:MAG TPA: type II toxin-antitoxin system PemK/MazF family toxin [Bacteroidia bacterium]|nr:type II toxin-antitoxin system PemK/MazF family toxin [Bacteroidia bacterium]
MKKKNIDFNDRNILTSHRQIWWTSVGLNVGDEEDGKNDNFERPVLVIKTFNRRIFLGIPITSQKKENKYYFEIEYHGKKYYLILSQIKLFSNKRLLRKITKIDSEIFIEIKKSLKEIINL